AGARRARPRRGDHVLPQLRRHGHVRRGPRAAADPGDGAGRGRRASVARDARRRPGGDGPGLGQARRRAARGAAGAGLRPRGRPGVRGALLDGAVHGAAV
ncbi:MAG: hypothetical protein AVDCRST_MAG35-2332, partial [uncultured Quadrisphaera sp.]